MKVVDLFSLLPSAVILRKTKINNVKVELITLKRGANRKILYIHGGGFLIEINGVYRRFVSQLAIRLKAQCFMVDYDLLPSNCFPKALNQFIAAYKALVERNGSSENIIVIGDSAGGNLALSLLVSLRDEGYPLPESLILLSPWLDLTLSGESLKTKMHSDPILAPHHLLRVAQAYSGGIFPTNPLISPLFANLKGLPPIFINVGIAEILLDDSLKFIQRANEAGVDVELHVGEGMTHVYPVLFPELPESKKTIEIIQAFVWSEKKFLEMRGVAQKDKLNDST